MSDNKVLAIIVVCVTAILICFTIFGEGSAMDTPDTVTQREKEKTKRIQEETKQLELKFKIDSLRAVSKK